MHCIILTVSSCIHGIILIDSSHMHYNFFRFFYGYTQNNSYSSYMYGLYNSYSFHMYAQHIFYSFYMYAVHNSYSIYIYALHKYLVIMLKKGTTGSFVPIWASDTSASKYHSLTLTSLYKNY